MDAASGGGILIYCISSQETGGTLRLRCSSAWRTDFHFPSHGSRAQTWSLNFKLGSGIFHPILQPYPGESCARSGQTAQQSLHMGHALRKFSPNWLHMH